MCGVDVIGEWVGKLKKVCRRGFEDFVLKWDEPETLVFCFGNRAKK